MLCPLAHVVQDLERGNELRDSLHIILVYVTSNPGSNEYRLTIASRSELDGSPDLEHSRDTSNELGDELSEYSSGINGRLITTSELAFGLVGYSWTR